MWRVPSGRVMSSCGVGPRNTRRSLPPAGSGADLRLGTWKCGGQHPQAWLLPFTAAAWVSTPGTRSRLWAASGRRQLERESAMVPARTCVPAGGARRIQGGPDDLQFHLHRAQDLLDQKHPRSLAGNPAFLIMITLEPRCEQLGWTSASCDRPARSCVSTGLRGELLERVRTAKGLHPADKLCLTLDVPRLHVAGVDLCRAVCRHSRKAGSYVRYPQQAYTKY